MTRLAPGLFVLLWSLGFIVAQVALRYAPPITVLAWRYALVMVLVVPLVAWLRPRWPHGVDVWRVASVGALLQGLYFSAAYMAMKGGASTTMVALVLSLQPIVIAALSPCLGTRMGRLAWWGVGLGALGAVLVISARGTAQSGALGIVLCLFALACIVGANVLEKTATSGDLLARHGVQYAAGLGVVWPLALWLEPGAVIVWHPDLYAAMAYLVLCNSLLAMGLLAWMIREGELHRVTALFFLVPPTSALMAWGLLGERFGPQVAIGIVLATLGVWMVRRT